jgi:hypothetical protein
MRKASIKIAMVVFPFLFLHSIGFAQNGCIFFYEPSTESYETNFYKKPQSKFDYKTQYNNIKTANVKNELNNAINHHDYRFIAISGNSILYPGLESASTSLSRKFERYIKLYKVKVIEGTNDVIYLNLPPLQKVAYQYAQEYNKRLLIKIATLENKKRR